MIPDFNTSDIRKLYFREKSQDEITGEWGAFILYRWLSFPVTGWFIKFGISANSISVLCIVASFLMCLIFLLPDGIGYLYLSIVAILISILDCVDGNIARITDTRSSKGQYLDFIADIIYRINLYIALGYIIQSSPVDLYFYKHALFFCLLSALLAIFSRLCRVYVETRFNQQLIGTLPGENRVINQKFHIKETLFSFFSGMDPLLPVFILITGFYHVIHWLLFWVFVYSLLDFVSTQYRIISRIE